ncbi:Secretion protein HlyD family protein OS=Pirellula staleyi (strain ATCC 27377 / DSM 6068 / ICPB 4128) GN=Psta_2961 PE=4 SV=1: HlyD_2 [Gemmataceae bacterium]|nr:Secretion protein HlyD family protein OS=Pirellula staleyi (strain ATCC 27377 / DSM 6068 / ICPB 4128) GN=Psta_2961 PE=4 SV=1: HlyD_2 [Gemmataceae bacterium]VTU01841.1 Secretion protein HlyD family protein OS=Pirellula staleyi (strain ATCC 27377 / DSM 6068 / ICPB 4128) GN=Psta_2961 PE=4 SV=1: HlyD_2 [Gemmataceae bacterium]
MPTAAEVPAPSANGELINRVQQLRLADQLGKGAGGSGRGAWLPWVLCAMMAATWAGVGVRWYKTAEPGAAGVPGAAGPVASGPASSGPATSGTANQPAAADALVLQIKGTVTPFLQINLSPDDVSGMVQQITFKEGDRVTRGTVLARIRKDRYQNDYDVAAASLVAAQQRLADLGKDAVRPDERRQAQAELDEAKAGLVRADQEVQRMKMQKAGGVVSQQDFEKAEADLHGAAARVSRLEAALSLLNMGARKEKIAAAQAEVIQAEGRLAEAKRLLENCEVKAPIDGTILTKLADRGVLVSPMSFNVAAGICSMADLSDLEAEIEVREDQIKDVRAGQRCEIVATADPSRTYAGRVDRVMPIADDTKNIIKVRVKIKLPAGEVAGSFLKPKMSTVVRIYNTDVPEHADKK